MSRSKKTWDHLVDHRGHYHPMGDKGLRGPKGQKGEGGVGPKGDLGQKGQKGDEGLAGQKGQKGLDGSAASNPAGNEGDVQINTGGIFGSATTGTFNYVDADNALSIDNLKVLDEVILIDDGGTNNISIAAPVAVTADYGIVLPADQATDVSTVINDGSGNLTWENQIDGGSF